MLYCRLLESDNKTVTYLYGGLPTDLTGIVVFNRDGSGFEIIKKPESTLARIPEIKKIYNVNKDNFRQGLFKEKLAYENC